MSTVFLLFCCSQSPCVGDDLGDLADALALAAESASNFSGAFMCYAGTDDSTSPPGFSLDGLSEQYRGRAWVESGQVVIEFFDDRDDQPADQPQIDVREVLAKSGGKLYRFTAVESSVTQYANLRVHDASSGINVQRQIDDTLLNPLKAITEVAEFPIASVLASPDANVRYDPVSHTFFVHARSAGPSPASISYELTINGGQAGTRTRLEMGPAASQIVVESSVEADHVESAIRPRRVVTRSSGPGYGPGRREVIIIEPVALPELSHPITVEYFRKYHRDFPVVYGDDEDTSDHVLAALPPGNLGLQPLPAAEDAESAWTGSRRAVIVFNLAVLGCVVLYIVIRRRRNRDA